MRRHGLPFDPDDIPRGHEATEIARRWANPSTEEEQRGERSVQRDRWLSRLAPVLPVLIVAGLVLALIWLGGE